jgi:predicted phosphodiesterase
VGGTGAVLVAVSLLLARSSFDPDAFERPRFYARGAELLQLLDAAAHSDERADRYSSKLEGTLIRLSDLLANSGVGGPPIGTGEDRRRALIGSDLHANALVVEPLEELAQPGSPVFLVGDFGHNGSESEARLIAPRLRKLGSRVVAVSGNHDSTALMSRLASAGVTVLDEDRPFVRADRLLVAGYPDPLEWHGDDPDDPERIFSFTEYPDEEEQRAKAEDDLVRWFDALPRRPDVVLVHQNGLAQHLAETVGARSDHRRLLVLTGHDHKQHVTRYDGVVVVNAGSAGAGGVLGIGDERVAVGDLHFASDSPALRAVDLIEVDPFSGAAQAQRVIVEGNGCDEGEASCLLSP